MDHVISEEYAHLDTPIGCDTVKTVVDEALGEE